MKGAGRVFVRVLTWIVLGREFVRMLTCERDG